MMLTMRDKAVALAKKGLWVFRLPANSKVPHKGSRHHSGDPAAFCAPVNHPFDVEWEWTDHETGQSRDDNIGIDTTRQLVVFDIDCKNGKSGREDWDKLVAELGPISTPVGYGVDTPSTGFHVYAWLPAGVRISNKKVFGPNIDIRAFHGYVLGEGSIIDGVEYTSIIWGDDIPTLPQAWLDRLARASEKRLENQTRLAPVDVPENIADAVEGLKRLYSSDLHNRNDSTYRAAAICNDYCVSEGLCYQLLLEHFPTGLEEEETLKTIRSVYRGNVQKPPGNATAEAHFGDMTISLPAPAPKDEQSDLDKEVARLASLPLLEYESIRKETAERLGVRVSVLDDAVTAKRSPAPKETEQGAFLQDPEPWPEPVDGAQLLSELVDTIKAHVILPAFGAEAAALWVLFAHAHDAFEVSPILAISAPERECGKTSLMNVIGALVPKPLPTSNISTAAVFRAVEKYRPTVLIDEADTFLDDKAELQGVLNSGHVRQSAFTARLVGDDHDLKMFSTWAPKAIAKIRDLPDTLRSRSVVIRLRRKLGHEKVKRLPKGHNEEFTVLRRKAFRWAQDNLEALRHCKPALPVGIENRAADNWEPLLAIADVIGWSDIAEAVAAALSGKASADEAEAPKSVALLSDIRAVFDEQDAEIFDEQNADRLSPTVLLRALQGLEESQWLDIGYGKPLTTHGLARMLLPFGIKSRRSDDARYYLRAYFTEAWQRYLTPAATHDAQSAP